jgi:branched-chain amino acid transport system ATP-binding protein
MNAQFGRHHAGLGRRNVRTVRAMKMQGTMVLLVEQNVELTLDIADRAYVLDRGAVVYHVPASELSADNETRGRYCTV